MQINSLLEPKNPTGKFQGTARYLGPLNEIGVFIHLDELRPRIFQINLAEVEGGLESGTFLAAQEPVADRAPASIDLSESAQKSFLRVKRAFEPYFGPEGIKKLLPKHNRVLALRQIARKARCTGRNARRLLYKFLASGGRQSSLVQRLDRCGTGEQRPPEVPPPDSTNQKPLTSRQARLALATTFKADLDSAASIVARGEKSIDKAWTALAATVWAAVSPEPGAPLDPSKVPTRRQVRYRADRLQQEWRARSSPNRRSYERASEDALPEVGYCYQIDATDSQVEVVSQIDRSIALRPATGYGVIDVGSTMIVGASISMHKPSWIACQRALFNAFSEKSTQLLRLGIEVPPDTWPCHHYCRVITSDRGELISDGAEVLASNFDMVADFCRSYTPEDKGTIERWFRTIKQDGLAGLDGYGEKFHKMTRGARNARPQLTPNELRRILYGCVIQYNFEPAPFAVIPPQLVAEGLCDVSRTAVWKWGLANAISAPRTGDARTIYACLLRRVTVSVREDGLVYKSLRYTSAELRSSGLLQRAERSGTFTMEAAYDEHLGSLLWFRTHEAAEWHTAELVNPASSMTFASFDEINLFQAALQRARDVTKVAAYQKATPFRESNSAIEQAAAASTPPPRDAPPGTSGTLRAAEKRLEGRLHAEDALGLAAQNTPAHAEPEPAQLARERAAADLAMELFE